MEGHWAIGPLGHWTAGSLGEPKPLSSAAMGPRGHHNIPLGREATGATLPVGTKLGHWDAVPLDRLTNRSPGNWAMMAPVLLLATSLLIELLGQPTAGPLSHAATGPLGPWATEPRGHWAT